jgi:hypothetical protein
MARARQSDRIDAVIAYHKRAKKPVGENKRLHATAHVIVENQAAMGDATVVPATLDRLMREGLDRHDAIHAIGSVLVGIASSTRSRAPKVRRSTSTRSMRARQRPA